MQTQTSQGHQDVRKDDTVECWRASETESVEDREQSRMETLRYLQKLSSQYSLTKSKQRLDQLIGRTNVFLL